MFNEARKTSVPIDWIFWLPHDMTQDDNASQLRKLMSKQKKHAKHIKDNNKHLISWWKCRVKTGGKQLNIKVFWCKIVCRKQITIKLWMIIVVVFTISLSKFYFSSIACAQTSSHVSIKKQRFSIRVFVSRYLRKMCVISISRRSVSIWNWFRFD